MSVWVLRLAVAGQRDKSFHPKRLAERAGGRVSRSLAQLRREAPQYYPAWLLTDESRESGSRVKVSGGSNLITADGRRTSTMEETAAILIIGDEVVSGLVQEGCSYSLMAALRRQGISTKQVRQKFDSAILPALSLP